jgi:hypothetical protein
MQQVKTKASIQHSLKSLLLKNDDIIKSAAEPDVM